MAKSIKKTEMTVTPTTKEENPKTTMTEKPQTSAITAIGAGDAAFLELYGKDVTRVASELPSPVAFQQIVDGLPDEYVDNLMSIIQKTMGSRKGIYGDDDRADFPELRAYQGTGNDPNRPDKQIPGEYYLTTKESVGEKFEGTVIAMWNGRTMWGDPDAGESTKMPKCHSMDRKIGSLCGKCDACPHLPWRDGQHQRCSDDVVAFMLSKDMKEIVLARFAKTSEPAGRQLKKLVKRSVYPWSRWFQLTLEQRTSPTDKSRRWYVMQVEPLKDSVVPPTVYAFCNAMCTTLEATHILPSMANVYRTGQSDENEVDEPGAGSAKMMPSTPGDAGSLDAFNDESETNI